MRIIVDIPNAQIKISDQLSFAKKISRVQIIRQALICHIINNANNKKAFQNAFGIWQDKNLDAIKY